MIDKTHSEKIKRLPKNKQLVHDSYLFRLWQWPQRQFDGSISTFELAECRDAVLVIAEMNGDIYFTKQKQSGCCEKYFYSLAGGYIEDGQSRLIAAKQELLQELGMASDDWQKIYQHNPNDKFAKTDYYYIARNCRIVAKQSLDPGEKIISQHMPMDQFFRTMPFHKNMRGADVLRIILCRQFTESDINYFIDMVKGKNR